MRLREIKAGVGLCRAHGSNLIMVALSRFYDPTELGDLD